MRELSIELHTSALDEAFRTAPDVLNKHLKAGISTAGSLVSRAVRRGTESRIYINSFYPLYRGWRVAENGNQFFALQRFCC